MDRRGVAVIIQTTSKNKRVPKEMGEFVQFLVMPVFFESAES